MDADRRPRARGEGRLFTAALTSLTALYVLLIVGLIAALGAYTSPGAVREALARPEIRHAFELSFLTSTATALLSLWVAVPAAYLLSRRTFRGKALVDAVLDIPILLPPMVVGLGLLILFQTPPARALERFVPITYEVPSVVIAQFSVAAAFAVRTLRVTFEQLDARQEDVARVLGCSRAQAFWRVALPQAGPGFVAAFLLAFARALGEFGPVLVFAGATRMKTEVLPSTVFLELSIGDLEAAAAVSLILVAAALAALLLARVLAGAFFVGGSRP